MRWYNIYACKLRLPPWFLCLLLLIIIAAIIRILPYLISDFFFQIGFDTGIYMRLFSFYSESNSWEVLPAFPLFPPAYEAYLDQVDPAFFVVMAMANQFMHLDLNSLFRFYLPILIGAISVIFGFVAGTHVAGDKLGGLLAAALITVSYIQVDAIDESFHRQIVAMLLLVLSMVYLDRYIEVHKQKYLVVSAILASGTISFHISSAILLVILLLYAIILIIYKKKGTKRALVVSSIVGIIFSLPAWFPRANTVIEMVFVSISESIWRISTLPSSEGMWTSGGAIPNLLWGFPHILIGYVWYFLPFVAISIFSYFIIRKRGIHSVIPILSVFLWFYIALWLFFGNRYLLNLDILLCLVAPVGLLYLFRKPKGYRLKVAVSICLAVIIISPSVYFVLSNQIEKSPYIVNNIAGIEWILENVEKENSVIFAPDYLSANLIQLGYDMAIWDYSLTNQQGHPSVYAETFIIEAPSNASFLSEFFSTHITYVNKNIYVLWGEWDLDRPLVETHQLIPVDAYEDSKFFTLGYEGYGEILKVYRYIGPR